MSMTPNWQPLGKWLILCWLLLLPAKAEAQYYVSGDDPGYLKWSQLQVGPFDLIYPQGQDELAYHYALLFQQEFPLVMKTLDADFRKHQRMPVILHSYSADANGMVAWPPRRMELYTIPSPSVSNLNWSRNLVLHEGRHVAQYLRSDEGVFRPLHYLLGEQSEGLAALYYAAPGFYEGDAVFAETAYSHGGRGRQASFLLPYRAYFADSIDFSYDKWQFGSYKHYIPNEYALGYMKWTAGQHLNLAGLDNPLMANAVIYDYLSGHLFRYKAAYKKAYGLTKVQLWSAAKDFYRERWREDSLRYVDTATPYPSLADKRDYSQYQSPIVLDNGKLLARKSSLAKSSRLIYFDPASQQSQTLFLTGNVNSPIRASQTHLYWTELVHHPRWQHESYSVLCSFNLADTLAARPAAGLTYLSRRSLYFHPSPSPDNRFIALSQANEMAQSRLVVCRTSDMQEVYSQLMPPFDELKEIVWADDNLLYYSVLNAEGLRLESLDLSSGIHQVCIPPVTRDFRHLSYHDGYLYFDADFDASTQIYRYHPENKSLEKMTHARFSASQAALSEDRLYFLDYSTLGNMPASISWDDLRPQEASLTAYEPFLIDELLAKQTSLSAQDSLEESTSVAMADISSPKPYHKLTHLFKFHSWAPLYYDKDQIASFSPNYYYQTVAPGLSLFTQNDLGTAYGQLGYSYHDGYHALHGRFTYSGWYPVFSLQVDYNDASAYNTFVRNDTLFKFNEHPSCQARLMAYVPLSFRRQAWTKQLIPSVQYYIDNSRWYSQKSRRYEYSSFMSWQLQASLSRDKAVRDIKSPLYAGLTMAMMHPMAKELYYTPQSLISLYGGSHISLLPNDVLSYQYGDQRYYYNDDTRLLMSPLLSTRGFDGIYAKQMHYHALDYTFPINMDLSIPRLTYIKRLETTLFVELLQAHESLISRDTDMQYRAAGIEASFNLIPLRINVNLNIGLRATLSDAPGGSGVEMIMKIPYL